MFRPDKGYAQRTKLVSCFTDWEYEILMCVKIHAFEDLDVK